MGSPIPQVIRRRWLQPAALVAPNTPHPFASRFPQGPYVAGPDGAAREDQRAIFGEVKGEDGQSKLVLLGVIISAASKEGIDCNALVGLFTASPLLYASTASLARLADELDTLSDEDLRAQVRMLGQFAHTNLALAES